MLRQPWPTVRCTARQAVAYARCAALAIGMDAEQAHTFALRDLARSRFCKDGANQEGALALLRNLTRFNGSAANPTIGLQHSGLASLIGDNDTALKLSAVHPTVDILESGAAALRKLRETTPPADSGRHASMNRTPEYTAAFPAHFADALSDAFSGAKRESLGFAEIDRSLSQVKITSGELTTIREDLYASGEVTRPELAEHQVAPSTLKKFLQLFGHSTDHPARLETHAVLSYTHVRVGPAPGARVSDKTADTWSAHHHYIAIVVYMHAVEAVGRFREIPAAQGVVPPSRPAEKFSTAGTAFPQLMHALLRVTHEMYAASALAHRAPYTLADRVV